MTSSFFSYDTISGGDPNRAVTQFKKALSYLSNGLPPLEVRVGYGHGIGDTVHTTVQVNGVGDQREGR